MQHLIEKMERGIDPEHDIYSDEQSVLHGSSLKELRHLRENVKQVVPALKEARERLMGELVKNEEYVERFPGDAIVLCAAAAYASAWPHFVRDNFVKSVILLGERAKRASFEEDENTRVE